MTQISDEVVARMCALVRAIADPDTAKGFLTLGYDRSIEAKEIAALLPDPVDPDLIEARKIAAGAAREQHIITAREAEEMVAGMHDSHSGVVAVLRAIKRGRELERQGALSMTPDIHDSVEGFMNNNRPFGRVASQPGSREPNRQAVSALPGFDPSRGPVGELTDHLERMIDLQMAAYPSGWTEDERREMAEHHLFGERM